MDLNKAFDPRAVAVIGASAEPNKLGFVLLENLLAGKKRHLYPINPTAKKIKGLVCHQSVLDVHDEIDLAIIAVPAMIVPKVLEECGRKKIPFVIIITAGFKEAGVRGKEAEASLQIIAKKYGIKIIGPNCLGIICAQTKLNASFSSESPLVGNIAFLSQSGAVCTAMLDWAKNKNIGFSKFVSLGNEAGLTENDFLEYLATDDDTKAICLYLEGVSDGRRFFELLSKITPHKPIVILKAGRSARSAQAVASHTGSLAPADSIFQAACRQAHAASVSDLRAMFNIVRLFNAGIYQPLTQLAILTNGGGPSIILADLIDASRDLTLVQIPDDTKNALRKILPPTAAVGNPVDLIGDAQDDRYRGALKILTADKSIEALAVILTPQKMTEIDKTADSIIKYSKMKPLLPIFIGEASMAEAEHKFRQNKIASFSYVADLVEALEALNFDDKLMLEANPSQAHGTNQQLDLLSSVKLLKKYNLVPSGKIVGSIKELPQAVKDLTFPLAMKVVSVDVVHKTDMGAVKLNISSSAEAQIAWQEIVKNVKTKVPQAKIDGMWVQSMIKGTEVIVGAKRDPNFGPVVVFGLGGIYVETLKDVTLRVAPIDLAEAQSMMKEIKGHDILTGTRGQKGINFQDVAKLIVAVSKLIAENDKIEEVDLNPVMLDGPNVSIVDARVIVKG